MPSKTIVAKNVYPPDKHPKYGRVVTAEGEKYSVEKSILPQLVQGGTYVIDYQVQDNGYMSIMGVQANVPREAANAHVSGDAKVKDDRIARLAIAKSIIEAHPIPHLAGLGTPEMLKVADSWWNWVNQ